MIYCIDTSSLIHAWKEAYPIKNFPSIWEYMDELIAEGSLIASEEVFEDLKKRDESLTEWAAKRKHIFLPLEEEIQKVASTIVAEYARLMDTRTGKSASDPWVIATAKVKGCKIITNEGPTGSFPRVRIPDVCDRMMISYTNFLGLIQERGWIVGGKGR